MCYKIDDLYEHIMCVTPFAPLYFMAIFISKTRLFNRVVASHCANSI